MTPEAATASPACVCTTAACAGARITDPPFGCSSPTALYLMLAATPLAISNSTSSSSSRGVRKALQRDAEGDLRERGRQVETTGGGRGQAPVRNSRRRSTHSPYTSPCIPSAMPLPPCFRHHLLTAPGMCSRHVLPASATHRPSHPPASSSGGLLAPLPHRVGSFSMRSLYLSTCVMYSSNT